ncbi:MAG: glycosyltransferase family 39 protein [Myxococcales bacterium]|nr:glycosyltransferase family 39 protein [Myxococcales bacterium]
MEKEREGRAGAVTPPPVPAPVPPPKGAPKKRLAMPKWLAFDQHTQVILGCLFLIAFGVAVVWYTHAPPIVGGLACGLPALVLSVTLMRKLRFDLTTIVIVAAGLGLYALYFTYTGYGERNYDGDAQLEYVQYLIKNKSLPTQETCFICHHPPIYYIVAAVAYRIFEVTGLEVPTRGPQLVSFVAIFVFLIYAALTIRRLSESRFVLRFAMALVVFWPYTVMNSARMHNDVLVSTFIAAGFYHVIAWFQSERLRDIALASLFSVLAVLTKSNGLVVPAVMGVVVAYRFLKGPGRWRILKRTVPAMLLAAAAIGTFVWKRGTGSEGGATGGLLGTAYQIHPRDFVGNEPGNYLYFDLEQFLREPYVMARRDGSGRQYYWDHLLKSSLFATHNNVPDGETSFRWNRRMAEVMNFLLLGMVGLTLGSLVMLRRRPDPSRPSRYFALGASAVMLIGLHMAFKMTIPSGHHGDFRFVYPVLITGAFAYAKATEAYRDRKLWLGKLSYGIGVTFVGMSILYYLPTYELVVKYLPKNIVRKAERDLKKVRNERVDWDDTGNTIILGDEVVEIEIAPTRDITGFEITVDSNDKYDIELYGEDDEGKPEVRHVIVGARGDELLRDAEMGKSTAPAPESAGKTPPGPAEQPAAPPKPEEPFKGLARYTRDLDVPVRSVRAVRVRPVTGDRCYSLGHLILK